MSVSGRQRRLRGLSPWLLLLLFAAGLGLGSAAAVWKLRDYRRDLARRLDLSGSGLQPQETQLPAPAANPPAAVVLLAGDSRIAQWPTPGRLAGAEALNLGRPGETSAQLLHRLEPDLLRRRPRLVILQTGINDLKAIGVFPDKADVIVENCWRNLRAVVAGLRAEEVRVVVLTIFPVGAIQLLRRPIWSDETLVAVRDINERLRQLSEEGVWVFDCDPIFSDGGRMRPEYAVDDFHINAAGYAALERRLLPFLEDLLRPGDGEMRADAIQ